SDTAARSSIAASQVKALMVRRHCPVLYWLRSRCSLPVLFVPLVNVRPPFRFAITQPLIRLQARIALFAAHVDEDHLCPDIVSQTFTLEAVRIPTDYPGIRPLA